MSRSLLRCRNPACPIAHGAVLGRLTRDGGLALDASVRKFNCYFDTRRTEVVCPICGWARTFYSSSILANRDG